MPGLGGEHCHTSSTICTESPTWTSNNAATCTQGTNTRVWRAIITLTRLIWQLVWGKMKSCRKQSDRQSQAYELLLLSLLLSSPDAPVETCPTAACSQKHHRTDTTAHILQPSFQPHCTALPFSAFLFNNTHLQINAPLEIKLTSESQVFTLACLPKCIMTDTASGSKHTYSCQIRPQG